MKTSRSLLSLSLISILFLGLAFQGWADPKTHSKYVRVGTDANFEKEVLGSKVPVLVDFWAPWCGPCRYYGPMVENAAERYKGKLRVVKVNVDENPKLSRRFSIEGIPTTLLYRNGKIVKRWSGAPRQEKDFQAFISDFLK